MVDCHCHLTDELLGNTADVLRSSAIAGVGAVVAVSENLPQARQLLHTSILQLKSFDGDKSTVETCDKYDFIAERVQEGSPDSTDPLSWSIIIPCAGIHPVQPGWMHPKLEQLDELSSFLDVNHELIGGIGECGLDFCPRTLKAPLNSPSPSVPYTSHASTSAAVGADGRASAVISIANGATHETVHTPTDSLELRVKALQARIFDAHITLGSSMDLALNVHSRQAGHYAIDALARDPRESLSPALATGRTVATLGKLSASDSDQSFLASRGSSTPSPRRGVPPRVLMHAFDGKAKFARKGVELGMRFSVAASIGRDRCLQKMAKSIPLDYLCLETDSPALHPISGDRINYPANTALACSKLAELLDESVDQIAAATTKSAAELFPSLPRLIRRRESKVRTRFGAIGRGGRRSSGDLGILEAIADESC